MKKLALFITMLLLSSRLLTAVGETLDAKTIEHVKAVVAIELNYISLKNDNSIIKKLNAIDNDSLKLDAIKTVVKDNQKNVVLIQNIASYNVSPESSVDQLVDSLFKMPAIIKFFEPNGRDSKATKKKITDRLVKPIGSAVEESHAMEGANLDNDKSNRKKNKDKNDGEATKNEGHGLFSLLPLIIIALLIGGCAYFFIALKKETESHKKDSKEASKKNSQLENELNNLKTEIKRLNNTIIHNEEEIRRLREENIRLRDGYRPQATSTYPTGRPQAAQAPAQKVYNGPKELFAQMASNGIFDNVQNQYDPNESMYKIATSDGVTGTYIFIDNPSAVVIAQNARDMFIESACNIINEEIRSFDHIKTITPGSVINTQNGWKISKKAQVELA